jgi:hypothetical protein
MLKTRYIFLLSIVTLYVVGLSITIQAAESKVSINQKYPLKRPKRD